MGYQKCKAAEIVKVAKDRPVFDFMAAIHPLAPSLQMYDLTFTRPGNSKGKLCLSYLRSSRCFGTTNV